MTIIRTIFKLSAVILFAVSASNFCLAQPLTQPPKGAEWKSLFNGENLDGWHLKVTPDAHSKMSWAVLNGVLVNIPPTKEGEHGIDLVSDTALGDHELFIEFMTFKGSNSGVYLIGQYEIQVLDSFGTAKVTDGDCGGIYGKVAPGENACLPPGQWQCFHAIFQKAEVKDGKVVRKPAITVYLNGKKVVDNAEIEGVTGAALSDKVIAEGPTYLQGNHGMVLYRNIFYKSNQK